MARWPASEAGKAKKREDGGDTLTLGQRCSRRIRLAVRRRCARLWLGEGDGGVPAWHRLVALRRQGGWYHFKPSAADTAVPGGHVFLWFFWKRVAIAGAAPPACSSPAGRDGAGQTKRRTPRASSAEGGGVGALTSSEMPICASSSVVAIREAQRGGVLRGSTCRPSMMALQFFCLPSWSCLITSQGP